MPASRRNIVLGMAAAGVVSGLPFVKTRSWYSSDDIFELADPTIMRDAELAAEEIERWQARARALGQEVHALIQPHDDVGDRDHRIELEPAVLQLMRAESQAYERAAETIVVRNRALVRALDDIYDKLRDGRLVARGRLPLAGANARKEWIPAGHWATLRFKVDYYSRECAEAPKDARLVTRIHLDHIGDYVGARNADVRYVEIEITRA